MTRKEANRRLAAALREQGTLRKEVHDLNAKIVAETSAPPTRYYPSGHAMPSGDRRLSAADRSRVEKLIERSQKASDRLAAVTSDIVNLRSLVGAEAPTAHARKKTPRQLDAEIAESLAKKKGKTSRGHATKRIAYRIKLTPSELKAVEFARGRYSWPDMLSQHALDDGSVAFTESEMWQWTDDVDADTEGGHSPFPLASGAFAEKLQRFYDERV
jgi:hypothetical protein